MEVFELRRKKLGIPPSYSTSAQSWASEPQWNTDRESLYRRKEEYGVEVEEDEDGFSQASFGGSVATDDRRHRKKNG